MLALKILGNKSFMKTLLTTDAFKKFCLLEATLVTAYTCHLDGRLHKDFYDREEEKSEESEQDELISWEEVKNTVYNLIKGKNPPISLKISLAACELWRKEITGVPYRKTVSGLFMNIKYEEQEIHLTTGVAYSEFIMDKSCEAAWDDCLKEFLNNLNIEFEELL